MSQKHYPLYIRQLPNILTVSRLFMAAYVFYLLLQPDSYARIAALVVFGIACLTDLLDGKIARATGVITAFGKIADPIADKILVLGSYIIFSVLHVMSPLWIVPIVLREVGVTVYRFIFLFQGRVLAAEQLGKIKVTVQMCSLLCGWCVLMGRAYWKSSSVYENVIALPLTVFFYCSLVCAVYFTVYSGVSFFRANNITWYGKIIR